MLRLLQQFAETLRGLTDQWSSTLQEALCGESLSFRLVSLTLHDHVRIKTEGIFKGFNDFSIYANGSHGTIQRRRPRFDIVEIAIPAEAGGRIATSRDLLRCSKDTALAMVTAVIVISSGASTKCLLQVAFLRAVSADRRDRVQASLQRHIVSKFQHMYYGIPCYEWSAIYPLLTLVRLALGIPDPNHRDCWFVYSLQYLSRAKWQCNLQEALAESDTFELPESVTSRVEAPLSRTMPHDSEAESDSELST